jgi:hypothetical protein
MNSQYDIEEGVTFRGINLMRKKDGEDLRICLDQNHAEKNKYLLQVNESRFVVEYNELTDSTSWNQSKLEYIIHFILKSDPFLDPPYVIAEKIFHYDGMTYPLLSPANNMALLVADILRMIAMPVYHTEHTIKGKQSFAIVLSLNNDEFLLQDVHVFRDQKVESYGVLSKESNTSSRNIAERIIKELRIIEEPVLTVHDFPSCNSL